MDIGNVLDLDKVPLIHLDPDVFKYALWRNAMALLQGPLLVLSPDLVREILNFCGLLCATVFSSNLEEIDQGSRFKVQILLALKVSHVVMDRPVLGHQWPWEETKAEVKNGKHGLNHFHII